MAGPTADRIVTPEAVVLDFETAGLASRLLSGAIDIAVQFLLLLVVIIGGVAVAEGFGGGGVAAAAVYFAIFLTLFGYPAAQETLWRGKTVGKAAMGLRVVTADGLPVRFRHAAIRSMLGLVDKFLASGAIGLIAILVSGRNQRLGDLVAGTIVLRERKASQAPVALAFPPPPGLEDYCA
ncbi:MAG: RDD family protein, partial [Acidimicrobiales bacterium]